MVGDDKSTSTKLPCTVNVLVRGGTLVMASKSNIATEVLEEGETSSSGMDLTEVGRNELTFLGLGFCSSIARAGGRQSRSPAVSPLQHLNRLEENILCTRVDVAQQG